MNAWKWPLRQVWLWTASFFKAIFLVEQSRLIFSESIMQSAFIPFRRCAFWFYRMNPFFLRASLLAQRPNLGQASGTIYVSSILLKKIALFIVNHFLIHKKLPLTDISIIILRNKGTTVWINYWDKGVLFRWDKKPRAISICFRSNKAFFSIWKL